MKRLFIACIVLLLAALALVAAIERDPGYVLISYGLHTIETSVWIALGVFIGLFALVYGLFSLWRRLISRGSALGRWLSNRGHQRSQQQTALGLINFIEGNWLNARKILAKAAEQSETPLLNYLMAARASHELQDDIKVQAYLKKAEQSTSGASIAVDLSLAEMQQDRGQFEQSLATLTRLRRNFDKHPQVLRLLVKAYRGINDAGGLLALLPELKKYKIFPTKQLLKLELSTAKACLDEAAKSRNSSASELDAQWKKLSSALTKNSELVVHYGQALIACEAGSRAEKLIRGQLKRDWSSELLGIYGRALGDDGKKQLLYAENWLKERNNDAALYLCLGRLSMREEQADKALEYLEHSLKLEHNASVCAELGGLLCQRGDYQRGAQYLQQGLVLATGR